MNIMTFVRKSGVKYQDLVVGAKGNCTNFILLGQCPEENCMFRHLVIMVQDAQQKEVKAGLEKGLAALASKQAA
jgi:hypothetical protein